MWKKGYLILKGFDRGFAWWWFFALAIVSKQELPSIA